MNLIRLLSILLVTLFAAGQEHSTPRIGQSNTPMPKLPVVDYNACPGKGDTVPNVEVSQPDNMYRSWEGKRIPIGSIKAGERVTVLGGVNVVRKPDTAIIKYVYADGDSSPLKVGSIALGYGIEADGNIVFWSNGMWFEEDMKLSRTSTAAASRQALA